MSPDALEVRAETASICQAFAREENVPSILLLGSLARMDVHLSDGLTDVDILIVDRNYAFRKARRLQSILSATRPNVKFDVGSYPLARLREERSLMLYDLRHTGFCLAGAAPKEIIPEITPMDLFPYEGFRLLFNRVASLLEDRDVFSPRGFEGPETAASRTAWRRARNAVRDARLIFDGSLVPSYQDRERLASGLFTLLPEKACDDDWLKEALQDAFRHGEQRAGSLDALARKARKDFRYPISFRVATMLRMQAPKALVVNPFLDALVACRDVVYNRSAPGAKARILAAWKRAPQPLMPTRKLSAPH